MNGINENPRETARMRRVLKTLKPGYQWVKQVNLMTPEQLRDTYLKMREARKIN